jgi:hypothetical protein
VAAHNQLFRIRGRRVVDGAPEERVFLFREFGVKVLMRRLEERFPEWEFDEPEGVEVVDPPKNEPRRIDTLTGLARGAS